MKSRFILLLTLIGVSFAAAQVPVPTSIDQYGVASDGMKLMADVYMPTGVTGSVPAVALIDSEHWAVDDPVPGAVIGKFNAIGWAAIQPHHHVAPDPTNCGTCNGTDPRQINDMHMAIHWLKSDSRFRHDAIFAMGGSGGGNLAGVLAAEGKVRAAVLLSPATDVYTLAHSTVASEQAAKRKALAYAPSDRKQLHASPVTYVTSQSAPIINAFAKVDQMPAGQQTLLDDKYKVSAVEDKSVLINVTGHGWGLYQYIDYTGFLLAHLPPIISKTDWILIAVGVLIVLSIIILLVARSRSRASN